MRRKEKQTEHYSVTAIFLTSRNFMKFSLYKTRNAYLHFRNDVHFTCNLTETDTDHVDLSGILTMKGKVFNVSGRFLLSDGMPVNGQIQLGPEGVSELLIFKYQLQTQPTGYSLKATLLRGSGYAEIEAHSTARHKFDWDLYLQVCLNCFFNK